MRLRQAANDVLRNDVALRAKGKLHFPNTKVLDFGGLFVFLGGKKHTHFTFYPTFLDLNLRLVCLCSNCGIDI